MKALRRCAARTAEAKSGRPVRSGDQFTLSLAAATGAILILGASPPEARADTLEEALERAYQNNAQLLQERAQLRATDENVPQALANWRPTVTVNADQGLQHNSSKQDCGKVPPSIFGVDCSYKALNTFQNLWPQSYGLTIAQPIFRGGRTVAQTAQALNQVRAERAHLVSVEQSVFLTVVTDYMNIVLAETNLELADAYEQTLQNEIFASQRRLIGGEVTLTDLSETEAFHAQALASRRTSAIQLDVVRAAYEHDVGTAPGSLQPPVATPVLPADVDSAVAIAVVANPDVVSAEFNQAAAEDNTNVIIGQRLPTVSLEATIQRAKEVTASGLRTDTGEVYAEVSVPIYEAGSIAAQIRQADQLTAARKHQVDDARRSAVQLARQSFKELEGAGGLIAALEQQTQAYEKALDGVRHEATVGDRSVFDILYQEQGLFQSRLSLAQARHDEIVARFTLAQAMGRLTARDLGLQVDYYDPDSYFLDVKDRNGLPR